MSDDFRLPSPNIIQTDNRPLGVLENEMYTRVEEISTSKVAEPGEQNPFSSELGNEFNKGKTADTGGVLEDGMGNRNKANRAQNSSGAYCEQSSSLAPELDLPVKHKADFNSASLFELLSKYERGGKKLEDKHFSNLGSENTSSRKLSTEEIIRVAAERYIQFPGKDLDCVTTFIHPYGSALSSLSMEETSGADLAHLLLAAADRIWEGKFDSARRLLSRSQCMSSKSGNPIERLTSYFSEALQERIRRETGSRKFKMVNENVRVPINGLSTGVDQTVVAIHEYIPFSKVVHFASTQTILEHVATETNIHVIDLHIRSGIHWPPMIQALSERKVHPVQLLKITALNTEDNQKVEDIGKRLESFANPLNINFLFVVVTVDDLSSLKKELLDIQSGEAVVIYASNILRTMIPRPDKLETLMRVIKELSPLIMILFEVDASDNSPSFINRFVAALFFYSTWFDCFEECLDRDNQYRMNLERYHFGEGIINTIATEGEERITRSVKIDVWRSYFARFQMVEVEIPKSSFHQAEMVLKKKFSCARFCTINNDDKCFIIRWKGTPMFSLSTWKFEQTPE
ncbi:Della protein rgl1 [Heracleum sosnowskyi]|uniref:Della protein rgl1 n=1 Tax=Heracleum sosnowskyi TaxID=360622 RepID=A0AAD8GU75_9APIA|nr:Della protein rgl1 [Heracleum sosnowskyi]